MSTKESILAAQRGFAAQATSSMVNILESGQHGFMPDLTVHNADANYVRRNLICIMLQAPRGFLDLPDPDMWISALKAMFERHATRIEGLRATLTVEHQEVAAGGAGEMQQDPSNVTRERSEPTFTWPEKYGKPFKHLLEGWILYLIGDPNTKTPMVVSRGLARNIDLLPEYTGATCAFIETDPSGTRVIEAWVSTNMRPTTSGAIEGSRDLTAGGELNELSIPFTALTQYGYGVRVYCQKLLDQMVRTGVNPNMAPSFVQEIDPEVARHNNGYMGQMEEASQVFLRQ